MPVIGFIEADEQVDKIPRDTETKTQVLRDRCSQARAIS